MATMRAKLKVTDVQVFKNDPQDMDKTTQETLHFSAVSSKFPYPEDGSDEDNTYARFTPSAELQMSVCNPALFGQFKVGDTFYVDFERVSAEG